MPTSSFILRYDIEGAPFAAQFLAADDFDLDTIKKICKAFGLSSVGRKTDLISSIERFLEHYPGAEQEILYGLVRRNKNWLAFKMGKIDKFPQFNNPIEIIFSEGKEEWYGPLQLPEDPTAGWYIRPVLIVTWEKDGDPPKPIERYVRWLLFAKVTSETLSFHWRGFTFATEEKYIDRASQFPYWNYIPNLMEYFEKKLHTKLNHPNLHDFVLYQLWDEYRGQSDVQWDDLRIRAESGGVSLSARSAGASSDVELDIQGIKHLANTISLSVEKELNLSLGVSEHSKLKETVLQTIIRQFGAKSYDFSLKKNDLKILKSHIYFGMKPNFPGPDCFPHINFHISWKDDQEQFLFITDKIKKMPRKANNELGQPSLL